MTLNLGEEIPVISTVSARVSADSRAFLNRRSTTARSA